MRRAGNEWQQPHRNSSLTATVRRLDLNNWGHRRRWLELSFADGLTEILVLLEDLHGCFKFFVARERLKTGFRNFDALRLSKTAVNENRSAIGVVIKCSSIHIGWWRRPG